MDTVKVKINQDGRLLLPLAIRNAMGIKPGDEVILCLDDRELRVTTSRLALERLRQMAREKVPKSFNAVDSLIADRRREAEGG